MAKRNIYAKALQQKGNQNQIIPGKKSDVSAHSSDFQDTCPLCYGSGHYDEASTANCPECKGTGEVELWR
jgi:DnaJ-class molecular chaperone